MNRPIKFRAFQDNQMISVPISSHYGLFRFFGILNDDAHIMQFTGLTDKNGKDIYEGDIVLVKGTKKIGEYKAIIEFRAQGFIINPNKTYFNNDSSFVRISEVIGNIHENKDLIDGKA